jgi:nucleoside-diphosphate-sugar epimerase
MLEIDVDSARRGSPQTQSAMNLLVTGSSGQIGAALCRRLSASQDATVSGLDRTSGPATSLLFDLCSGNSGQLPRAEVVFHLAGRFEKNFDKRGEATAQEYERDNVTATRCVLDMVERWQARLIYSSTLLLSEQPRSQDAYTATKAAAEDLVRTRSSVRSAILRLPRVLGFELPPHAPAGSIPDRMRQLPPDIVSMFLAQALPTGVIEYYSGHLSRWYIHLSEAVDCFEACSREQGLFDARLHDAISIEAVARTVAKLAEASGSQVALRHIQRDAADKQMNSSPLSLRSRVKGRFPSSEALIEAVAADYLGFALEGHK